MFDFAWSEIGLIALVALLVIGPKDLPTAVKGITDMIKKARKMAGEFQTHVDEMVREANLTEVRNQFSEVRNFDLKGTLSRAVDPDRSLRQTFTGNPLRPDPVAPAASPVVAAAHETAPVADAGTASTMAEQGPLRGFLGEAAMRPLDTTPPADAPAWLKPPRLDLGRPDPAEAPPFIPPQIANPPQRPAFIPPNARGPAD